jgi:DNA helicase HerA-like ATPase
MQINSGEHVVVLGSTGSGKTFFCRNALLPAFSRIIVLDPEDYDFTDWPRVSVKQALKLAKSDYSFAVRIVLSGNPETDQPIADELNRGLLKDGHDLVVYYDEISDLSDAHKIPPTLRALIRKARKRGITVAVGTQRPALLSKDYLANSQHRIYFFVSDYDAEAIHDYAPWMRERRAEIPYKSYKSIYQAPDESLTVLGPAEEFDWGPRLRRKK